MTAQFPDELVHRGETLPLFSNPLETYYLHAARPAFDSTSTANWRGYIAAWEIDDDHLFLTAIRGQVNGVPVGLAELFPEADGRVEATWYSGLLRVPLGELLHYVHMGYGSTYERDRLLVIYLGRLVFEEVIDTRTCERSGLRMTDHGRTVFGDVEWGFLRAVRADLNDDTPKRIYADWLEERGDPRAEVVRIITRLRQSPDETEAESLRNRLETLQKQLAPQGPRHWLWRVLLVPPRR